MKNALFSLCVSIALMLSGGLADGEVTLPPIISSHMVLQRQMPVPIWGTAAPQEKVTVKFQGQEKTTQAAADGSWAIKLEPLAVGDPAPMTVTGTNTLTLEDVLVGEVWIGSGQSNMAGNVSLLSKNDPAMTRLAAESYPRIRLVQANGAWRAAAPGSISSFSAILFAFGVPLQKDLNVPVGLMLGAAGGTPSGQWLTAEMFKSDAPCQALVTKAAATYDPAPPKANYERALLKYEQDKAAWDKLVADAKTNATSQPDARKAPRKPDPPLAPGEFRGQYGDLYLKCIKPFVPFAIRGVLWDQGESGTAIQSVDQYTLMGALIKGWRTDWHQGDFAFLYVQKPSGEGCAFDPQDPVTSKAEAFAPLPAAVPTDGAFREMHIRIMQYPNTAMVTASDLGSGIHPSNKAGYGQRAARVALATVYHTPIEYYGPLYASQQVEGSKIRIRFTHVGQGLTFRGGDKLQGFAIAGADKKFYWADATIDGDTVIVSSEKVAEPVAARYAWSEKHPWANLFNKDGLPALSFSTDGR